MLNATKYQTDFVLLIPSLAASIVALIASVYVFRAAKPAKREYRSIQEMKDEGSKREKLAA